MKSKLVNFVIACTLYSCYLQSGAVKQPLRDINPWDTKDLVQGTSMIYDKHVYLINIRCILSRIGDKYQMIKFSSENNRQVFIQH